jgi:hypothetical protein
MTPVQRFVPQHRAVLSRLTALTADAHPPPEVSADVVGHLATPVSRQQLHASSIHHRRQLSPDDRVPMRPKAASRSRPSNDVMAHRSIATSRHEDNILYSPCCVLVSLAVGDVARDSEEARLVGKVDRA